MYSSLKPSVNGPVHGLFVIGVGPDEPLVGEREKLHGKDGGDVVLGVDPTMGVEKTGPRQRACRAETR